MKKYVHTFSKNHPLQACGGKEKYTEISSRSFMKNFEKKLKTIEKEYKIVEKKYF